MTDFEKMLAMEHLPKVGQTSASLNSKGSYALGAHKNVKIKRIKGRKSTKELFASDAD